MFREYRKKEIFELRKVTQKDLDQYEKEDCIIVCSNKDTVIHVVNTEKNTQTQPPKLGDMIARNPTNYLDQWLIRKEDFEEYFELNR